MSTPNGFLTPVGRLVSGSLYEGNSTDDNGQQFIDKNGNPYSKYGFGVAFEKNNTEFAQIEAMARQTAQAAFPSMFDAQFNCLRPDSFSMKVIDGDSQVPNQNNKKPCDKPGHPGHWVVWFSGAFAPKVFDNAYNLLTEPGAVKKGYYVRVNGSHNGNGNQKKPGIYWNYNGVQLQGYGEEITTGATAQQMFSAPASAVGPAGMSATPVAAASVPSGPTAPPVAAVAPPVAAVAPPVAAVAPPVAPAPDFVKGPPVKTMTAAAQGATYEQMVAVGWTDETLVAQGMMTVS